MSKNTEVLTCQKIEQHSCMICNDTGFIYDKEKNIAHSCSCLGKRNFERYISRSGIAKAFSKFNIENYKEVSKETRIAKNTAISYANDFITIESKKNNSIAFLGTPGAGKTHLCISIANTLIEQNIKVIYMGYREEITQIKQDMINDLKSYISKMENYKKARVLVIDDLYKGKITDTDINIIFEIINYRYFNGLATIFSSEFTQEKLLSMDEAIGSRIIEMSKSRICEFQGIEHNYRLQ